MVSTMSATLESIDETIDFACRRTKNHLNLKIEQREAIQFKASGRDTTVVLPTGFGKPLLLSPNRY